MSTPATTPRAFTPRSLARFLAVSADKVMGWIRRGDLVAVDVGGTPGKPRFRILPQDLERFLQSKRAAAQPAANKSRRGPKSQKPDGWVERY